MENDDEQESTTSGRGRGPATPGEWMQNGNQLMSRTVQITQQLQSDWDSMAERDRAWTTDTIMNEVVNSWEHFTPVLGEWIQHSVDGTAIALRSMWPSAPQQLRAMGSRVEASPVGEDMGEYAEISASAAERMIADDYTSADAVEDWANLCGKVTKDGWAAAARMRRSTPRFPNF